MKNISLRCCRNWKQTCQIYQTFLRNSRNRKIVDRIVDFIQYPSKSITLILLELEPLNILSVGDFNTMISSKEDDNETAIGCFELDEKMREDDH